MSNDEICVRYRQAKMGQKVKIAMVIKRSDSKDPVEVGICAGCGNPIYSNEDYLQDGEAVIHADGVGARATIVGAEKSRQINVSCLLLYLHETCLEDEAARLLGIEKKTA